MMDIFFYAVDSIRHDDPAYNFWAYGMVIVGTLGILTGLFIGSWMIRKDVKISKDSEINQELHRFYYPLQRLLKTSERLYFLLTAKGFQDEQRVIIALLNGNKIKGNNKILLEKIIDINKRVEEFIFDNHALVNDREINKLLAKASTHYMLLHLAFEGKLEGEEERFEDHLYPTELNSHIDKKIEKLEKDLEINSNIIEYLKKKIKLIKEKIQDKFNSQ